MAAPKKLINLSPRKAAEATLDKVLNWTLTAGRIIVVTTELVVIVAFLSRFWLDRQITDINSQIKTQGALIEASKEFEQSFRNLQIALSAFSQIRSSQPNPQDVLGQISSSLPNDVSLQNVTISSGELQIKGVSLSEIGIAGFIKNLNDAGLGEVELKNISFAEAEINFQISAKIKEGK